MVKRRIIDDAGVKRMLLPRRSPDLNTYVECWVRFVMNNWLSHLILCGEALSDMPSTIMESIIIRNVPTRA